MVGEKLLFIKGVIGISGKITHIAVVFATSFSLLQSRLISDSSCIVHHIHMYKIDSLKIIYVVCMMQSLQTKRDEVSIVAIGPE